MRGKKVIFHFYFLFQFFTSLIHTHTHTYIYIHKYNHLSLYTPNHRHHSHHHHHHHHHLHRHLQQFHRNINIINKQLINNKRAELELELFEVMRAQLKVNRASARLHS
ncbi:hypothetical protein Hanom_Chr03g00235991 [Helianthus anomalus]